MLSSSARSALEVWSPHPGLREHLDGLRQRQADHVCVGALDRADQHGSPALDPVGARLVHGLAGGQVSLDGGRVQGPEDIVLSGDLEGLDHIDLVGDMPAEGKYPFDLIDRFPSDVQLIRGAQRACKEGCMNNPLAAIQVIHADHGGRGGFTFVFGKGHASQAIDAIEGRVLVVGPCAVEEVSERLIERLARNIHEGPTAAAHLRTLGRGIDVRLLDVLPSTSPGPNADFSSQSTHLHALATDPHE